MAPDGPERIVFVGGAPRSGTSVTHALICTSNRVSRYSPEISFFRPIPQAYRSGRLTWEQHTSAFFEDVEAFRRHMRESADLRLGHIWRSLGAPPILAVKDPHLTPFFPDLGELYPKIGRFVTVIRHPYEVVRSRQDVHERQQTGTPFTVEDAQRVAEEFLSYYAAVLNTNFGGRHFAFRYEDLNDKGLQRTLAKFLGVDDLHARPLWGDAKESGENPWFTPKYHQPIDLAPRLGDLAPELAAATREICNPLMERFGYS